MTIKRTVFVSILEVRVSVRVRVRVGFICLFITFSYFLFAYRKIRNVLTGVLARVVARYIGILVKVTFKIQPL